MHSDNSEADTKKLFAYMWKVATVTAVIFGFPVALLVDSHPWVIIVPMMIGTVIIFRRIYETFH